MNQIWEARQKFYQQENPQGRGFLAEREKQVERKRKNLVLDGGGRGVSTPGRAQEKEKREKVRKSQV